MSTKRLINKLNRHDNKRKHKRISKIGLEKITKLPNISENKLNQIEKLQRKSIEELKEIARLRRIKNIEKLTKEDLIIALLKSENSTAEHNFEKNFNNNDANANDDTYDDRIRAKIRDNKIIFNRLGNIVTNKDRKKITKKLYDIEKNQNFWDRAKEEINNYLVNLTNTHNNKEKYKYHDRDDLDYYGVKDIKNLFDNVDDDNDDYYKPILIKSSFKNNYKYYENRGDKYKNL